MRRLSTLILAVVSLFLSSPGIAQVKMYQFDTTLKMFAYGKSLTFAFSGGFNTPQFTMGDLNRDGVEDLVVFEPWNSLRTFINHGTPGHPDYRYAPEYEHNFPPIYDYIILTDYNCDGIPDLFHEGSFGVSVYRGYYNSLNQLCFTFYQDLYVYNDLYAGGRENVFNNPGDIPSVVDIDHDGDLDVVSYYEGGGWMYLYKNMQVEMGLPCDSMHMALKDRCWGRVFQAYDRTHELAMNCDNTHLLKPAPKKTHTGNTPCLFDWDQDGDFDYLDGSISFPQMTFLLNGRIELGASIDTMVSQDTTWQGVPGGKSVNIPLWPAAFNIDFDQDGNKDLMMASNLKGYENYHIWFYKNYTSTPGAPDWEFQSDSMLNDIGIDLGTGSYPMYFDYDKDGKPDLFIGSDGYYQPATNQLRSRISYYRNTSTPGNPSFTLQTNDFMGLNTYNWKGAAPAFGDIDGDGKTDMVIGHTDGTLSYFTNIATSDTVQPVWQLMQLKMVDVDGDTINTGGYSAPFIYRIDTDSRADLIIGNIFGTLVYYQNLSTTPGTLALKLVSTHLGNIQADPALSYGVFSTPFIGKIDSTGVDYLLLGSNSGLIYRFTGFQTGDTTATYTMLDSAYAYIDTTYSQYRSSGTFYGIYSGLRSSVTVADVTGNGDMHMIVGNNKGGVEDYRLKVYIPPPIDHTGVQQVEEHGKVIAYPNPADDVLNISWAGMLQAVVQINVMNMQGQSVYSISLPGTYDHTQISTSLLPPGMYVLQMMSGVNRYYNKFSVIR